MQKIRSKPKSLNRRQRARQTAIGLLRQRGKAVSGSAPRELLIDLLKRYGLAPRNFNGGLGNWFSWWNQKQGGEGRLSKPEPPKPRTFVLDYGERARSLAVLKFSSYSDYIESKKWIGIRRRVLSRDGGKCQLCEARATQVHHRAYDLQTMAGRDLRGLVAICEDCHREIEFEYPGQKSAPEQVTIKFEKKRKERSTILVLKLKEAFMALPIEDSTKPAVPFSQARIGDRGQRYEVRYTDAETGAEKVMGWTDKADGGGLLRSALQWPAVKQRPDGTRIAWVVDRRPGGK